ncbi:MAG: hypothetical protein ACLSVD_07635 [Eggerthellaceae bacterium]
MELGTLPEWFTACAEVLAVCTALFLPQYGVPQPQASYDRMLRVASGLLRDTWPTTGTLLRVRCRLQLEAPELQLYLRVSFYALSEARKSRCAPKSSASIGASSRRTPTCPPSARRSPRSKEAAER